MRTRLLAGVLATLLIASSLLLTGAAPVPPGPPGHVASGEILVKVAPGESIDAVVGRLQAPRPKVRRVFESDDAVLSRWYAVSVPPGSERSRAARYAQESGVEGAEPVHLFESTGVIDDPTWLPNDPFIYRQQWNLDQVRAPAAWKLHRQYGLEDTLVAVIDSGVDPYHEDLIDILVDGRDFSRESWNKPVSTQDVSGHGTHVAGIIAAIHNNGVGITGVAPGSRVMPVRTSSAHEPPIAIEEAPELVNEVLNNVRDRVKAGYDRTREWTESDRLAQAIWASADSGARVVNMSIEGKVATEVVRDAVLYADRVGVVLVASAGNTADGKPRYPAAYDEVICVAATDENEYIWAKSNYGNGYIAVAAPGVGVWSCYPVRAKGDRGYEPMDGTSQAAPHVSGLAAMMLSIDPMLRPSDVRQIINDTALDRGSIGYDEKYGHGIIQADRALEEVIRRQQPSAVSVTSLQGHRRNLAWTTGNLGSDYLEGDSVPYRLILQNDSSRDVPVPELWFHLDHYDNNTNAVLFDATRGWCYEIRDSLPGSSDPGTPPPGRIPLIPEPHDEALLGTSRLTKSIIPAGSFTVPAGKFAVVYFQADLARTLDWMLLQNKNGAAYFSGSSYGVRVLVGDSSKVVSAPFVVTPVGDLIGKWGQYGNGTSQFDTRTALDIAPSGDVYVLESGNMADGNKRVQWFSPTGTYLGQWAIPHGSGDGQARQTSAIAIDSSGDVYVADVNNWRVLKFSSTGAFLEVFYSPPPAGGAYFFPMGLAVNPMNDDLYVIDASHGTYPKRVLIFESDGTLKGQFGSYGTGNGQFVYPVGVAVSSTGSVYVADGANENRYIQKFTPDGIFVGKWGGSGSGDGQFDNFLLDVASAPNGDVFAVVNQRQLARFDGDGNFIARFGPSWGGADVAIQVSPVNGHIYTFNLNYEIHVRYGPKSR